MAIKDTFSRGRFIRVLPMLLWVSMLVAPVSAQPSPFPVPAGLEEAVTFWKQVFTRYGADQIVLFDPMDFSKVYSVVRAPDSEVGRALVDKERAKIVAEYDLVDDENRIRSQRGAREHFLEGLKISGRYLGQMQRIFREEGLPPELAYLPLVESSFNVRARSSVGAVGMWQFMPDTGKKFLRIDAAVDERRDPMASTKAAARLLKENFRIFGNWPLAITAYNHGTEGILRGIKTLESDDLGDLIRGYQSPTFGFASKNFYAEFLAVVEIGTNSEQYFPFLRAHRPVTLHEVQVKGPAALQAVLSPAAISQRDFFEWNPALETTAKTIPVGYRVKLPPDKVDDFVAAHKRAGAAMSRNKIAATRKPALQKSAASARSKVGASAVKSPQTALAAVNAAGKATASARKRAGASREQLKLAAR